MRLVLDSMPTDGEDIDIGSMTINVAALTYVQSHINLDIARLR